MRRESRQRLLHRIPQSTDREKNRLSGAPCLSPDWVTPPVGAIALGSTVSAHAADADTHPAAGDGPRLPAAQAPRAGAGVRAAVRHRARVLPRGERRALHGCAAARRRSGRPGPARHALLTARPVRERPALCRLVVHERGDRACVRHGDGRHVQGPAGAPGADAAARGAARRPADLRWRGPRAAAVRAARLRARRRPASARRALPRMGREPVLHAAPARRGAAARPAHAPLRADPGARRAEALLGRRRRGGEAARAAARAGCRAIPSGS